MPYSLEEDIPAVRRTNCPLADSGSLTIPSRLGPACIKWAYPCALSTLLVLVYCCFPTWLNFDTENGAYMLLPNVECLRIMALQPPHRGEVLKLKKKKFEIFLVPTGTGTYLLTYGAEPFLRSHQLCSLSRTSQEFKEPEGSLPCSQEPSTGPHPQPDRSSSYHHIPSLLRSSLILSTHLRQGLPNGPFPFAFSTNILYAFLFPLIRATGTGYITYLTIWNTCSVMTPASTLKGECKIL
jgi:hypothetical protein